MSEQNGTTNVVQTRQRYRKRMNYSIGAGIVLGIVLMVAGAFVGDLYTVLGVGVYWIGGLAFGVFWYRSPVSVQDERQQRIEEEAASLTLGVLSVAVILAAPTVTVLETTGVHDVSPFVWGGVTTLVLVSLVFGVAHWYTKRKQS